MKVTSTKTISFPKYDWGINRGQERDLPDNKEAQEAILESPYIIQSGSSPKVEKNDEDKPKKITNNNG